MNNVEFSKIGLEPIIETEEIELNDKIIVVTKYLPIQKKLELISDIINSSIDNFKFYNVGKLKIYTTIYKLKYYTNISFTDEELEDACDAYDLIINYDLEKTVDDIIGEDELCEINSMLDKTISLLYTYTQSLVGAIDSIVTDYKDMDLNATNIQQKIADPKNLELIKEVVTKLG